MATSYINEVVSVLPPSGDNVRDDFGFPIMSSLGLDIPLSTVSSPSPPSAVVKNTRKYSLLADLIESENAYVELLTGIIRKVASAWSRSNLPPPELDVIFRSVEGVYKTNRMLLAKLKEIGENPSSPKALGDLLMRWIDELDHPYTTYADRYCLGFDDWEPIKSNAKLPTVLQAFSTSLPPPSALPESTRLLNPSLWTLDALFLLPKGRLQYYRRLYSRLLKSTTPGRSDHRLLTEALGKLDSLLATLEDRANIYVGTALPPQIPLLSHTNSGPNLTTVVPMPFYTNEQVEGGAPRSERSIVDPTSIAIPPQSTFSSGDERLSQEGTLISPSRESSRATSSPVLDLERRLATDHTLDIFTMQLKQIRLQITPPTLSYSRELRLTVKVFVRFTPKATGVEVIHPQGHIYILSDLFLLCEEMAREERIARAGDGRDMHLCYPPLSGKVLEVVEVPGQDNALQVSIMRKETMVFQANSQFVRDRILNEFQECISYAKMISGAAQEPVPPMSPSGNPPQLPAKTTRERPDRALNPQLLPQSQPANVLSEQTGATSLMDRTQASSPKQNVGSHSQHNIEQQHATLPQLETVQNSGRDVVISPLSKPASLDTRQRAPAEPVYPSRRSSRAHNSPPSSFVPGQIIPPMRSASMQSQSPPFGVPPPDLPSEPLIAQNHVLQNPALKHHASMYSLRQQPLRHQPSSPPHKPQQQTFYPGPHPQPVPHFSNTQPFTHPSIPPVTSQSVEQSFPRLQKSSSSRSLHAQHQYSQTSLPPLPSLPSLPIPQQPYSQRKDSMGSLNTPMSRPLPPSMQMGSRTNSIAETSILDPSPPTSPAEERKPLGPVRSVITAQMKCKVFHQQQHAQWKSLGSANLTLYREEPTNVKQLVVEAGNKEKSVLISTIVLTDGVERVGKTGVAIELSGSGGARTGVIYMIQLRNEDSASNLFKTLLAGSDRAT